MTIAGTNVEALVLRPGGCMLRRQGFPPIRRPESRASDELSGLSSASGGALPFAMEPSTACAFLERSIFFSSVVPEAHSPRS
ncbi:MAG: hypothetical protein JWN04_3055 [Myxococcaceae bacterium]|nr:hypothetical protein [Myxococcaceae bacterium]